MIKGVVDGCNQSGCTLLGGETAEMPGFYQSGEYDLAGFAVGAVKKDALIDGKTIKVGDVVLALKSSGVHSNGFSLVRKVCNGRGGGQKDGGERGNPVRTIRVYPCCFLKFAFASSAVMRPGDREGYVPPLMLSHPLSCIQMLEMIEMIEVPP